MRAHSRRTLAAVVLMCGLLVTLSAFAQSPSPADDKALAAALRGGGLVILVRHGATFPDQADTDPFHLDNIAAQRNLNDKGKALAQSFRRVAAAIRRSCRSRLHQQVQPRL
jgi:hypothetical protein